MKRRLARIIFTRGLVATGCLKAGNLEDLFAELPEETKIINFAEDLCRDVMQITVEHGSFKEVDVGNEIPEIVAKFTKDADGVEHCEVDLSEVLVTPRFYGTPASTVIYDEYADGLVEDIYRSISDSVIHGTGKLVIAGTPKQCNHEWDEVKGIYTTYIICKHCGERK